MLIHPRVFFPLNVYSESLHCLAVLFFWNAKSGTCKLINEVCSLAMMILILLALIEAFNMLIMLVL